MEYRTLAKSYVGVKEGSKAHHEIIDFYNSHIKPLPRGYKVKYSDSWCATFVSVILYKCDAKNAPYECGVYDMYKKACRCGEIVSTPKRNDLVIYDWGHNGSLDHVGIIDNIVGNTLTVIEGNKNDAVGVRMISKNDKSIAHFIRVPQKLDKVIKSDNLNSVVSDVLKGKYGNGAVRKKKLESLGYDYNTIQKLVNERLKK